MTTLSIIVLSYNTKDTTYKTIRALIESLRKTPSFTFEVIIVDNASHDGSVEMLNQVQRELSRHNITIRIIQNNVNVGFPKGNNQGVRISSGKFVLFLNSDVIVQSVDWVDIIRFMEGHEKCGAMTVRVELPDGSIDPASHRGFPTIWNAFCYYSGLERLTKNIPQLNTYFGGYHLTHLDLSTQHQIDSPSGAFYLMKRALFDEISGFDETFFMYGEDLDLSFRIREKGYTIEYYPKHTVLHLKYQSGLQTKTQSTKSKTRGYFYDAMKIFYKKHYAALHPSFINTIIYALIDLKSKQ